MRNTYIHNVVCVRCEMLRGIKQQHAGSGYSRNNLINTKSAITIAIGKRDYYC